MHQPTSYIYGINTVLDLITHSGHTVLTLYCDQTRKDRRIQNIIEQANIAGIGCELLGKAEFNHIVGRIDTDTASINHQGVVALCQASEEKDEAYLFAMLKQLETPPVLLILDGVTDPHNLGACLRSANAVGSNAVIVPKDNAVGLNATVRKVASGAAESTPLVVVKNLARFMKKLKQTGVWIMGAAAAENDSIYSLDLTVPVALVMGSEGSGMRRLTRESCDQLFAIPMSGTVESLNVSVAAAISLFEVQRQRR